MRPQMPIQEATRWQRYAQRFVLLCVANAKSAGASRLMGEAAGDVKLTHSPPFTTDVNAWSYTSTPPHVCTGLLLHATADGPRYHADNLNRF
jgi:hypothetical protein